MTTAIQQRGTVDAIDFQGLPALALTGPQGAQAIVALHGAHVLSWIPAASTEKLYLSDKADVSGAGPIRGGVPVCFPQFSGHGPLPKHGLVRTLTWQSLEQHASEDVTSVVLGTDDSAVNHALWPHPFRLRLHVALAATTLTITLHAHNTGDAPFTFTTALHTYLAVADIATAYLDGLGGVGYRDAANGNRAATQATPRLTFAGEIDRVYHAAPGLLLGRDGVAAMSIQAAGFADTVVWNPGPELCARLADMPVDGHRHMLCVEAACADSPVTLGPGQSWEGSQRLTALL
ncbi:MAG: D-hexose-6-phosphate mutarotase [Burkholderiales bacterium]|nr:D-hexose-6-phosphate mutarotase [Burkholderiales bacterium]